MGRYGLERAASWTSDLRYQPPASQVYVPDETLFWVYCGSSGARIGSGLKDLLLGKGLAREAPDGGPWVGMNSRLGSVYMATLTDAVARHNNLCPTTDDFRIHHALGALDQLAVMLLGEPTPSPAFDDAASAYLHVALDAVLEPERISEVPISRIIEFRQKHEEELRGFRDHIAGLSAELAKITSIENVDIARAQIEDLYNAETAPRLAELRKAMRSFGIKSVAGALGLKLDLGAASTTAIGVAAVAAGLPVIAGIAAVALSIIPYVASRIGEYGEARSGSPVAYLLAANRELHGRALVARAH